jgi:hypothetical protein
VDHDVLPVYRLRGCREVCLERLLRDVHEASVGSISPTKQAQCEQSLCTFQ